MLRFVKTVVIGLLTGIVAFFDVFDVIFDKDPSFDDEDSRRKKEADDFYAFQEIEAQRRAASYDPQDKDPYDWSTDQGWS